MSTTMKAVPNDDSGHEWVVKHGLYIYEVDFGKGIKGRYVRLKDFNRVCAEMEANEVAKWKDLQLKNDQLEIENKALRKQMAAVARFVNPNWSNDMSWSDEIIIAIQQNARERCGTEGAAKPAQGKPVGTISGTRVGVGDNRRQMIILSANQEWLDEGTDLYTYSATAERLNVPDEMKPELCAPISLEWMARRSGYRDGWNACRSAMLKSMEDKA